MNSFRKISIVIPVYNTSNFLHRCIDSFIDKIDNYNLEVIIIDDCSTDNSWDIIKEYKTNFPNIRAYRNEINIGLAQTRRKGILLSEGEYITHIDSDDYYNKDVFEILQESILKADPDILMFGIDKLLGDKTIPLLEFYNTTYYSDSDKYKVINHFFGATINKLVSKKLFQDFEYGKTYLNTAEDLVYSMEVFIKAKSILVIPKIKYNYVINSNSLTQSINFQNFVDLQIKPIAELHKLFTKYKCEGYIQKKAIKYIEKSIYYSIISQYRLNSKHKISLANYYNLYESTDLRFSSKKNLKRANENIIFCLLMFCKYESFYNVCIISFKIIYKKIFARK